MKPLLCLFVGIILCGLRASADDDTALLAPDEVEKLVAPIALYPDALVALILPASTSSSDVVLAARFCEAGGQPADIDSQAWAESVRSLAHYPEIIRWMDNNLAWTQQLGAVFQEQPSDVMAAIQRLRAAARASGALVDTPQQRVIVQESVVCIEPAVPDVIYVPRYDATDLCLRRFRPGSYITFGVGFGAGGWLSYRCDWHRHVVNRGHYDSQEWRRRQGPPPSTVTVITGTRPWRNEPRHPPYYVHPIRPGDGHRPIVSGPHAVPVAPGRPHPSHPFDGARRIGPPDHRHLPPPSVAPSQTNNSGGVPPGATPPPAPRQGRDSGRHVGNRY